MNNFFGIKQLILVFLFKFLVALLHNTTGVTTIADHDRRQRKWPPSAPHEALRSTQMLRMNRLQPPKLADVIFWVVEGVCALKALLCSGDDEPP